MDSNVPSITNLLEELENIIEESRAVPFSRNISVDKDTIMDIIADMRANLPNQLKQAEKIVSNCNKTRLRLRLSSSHLTTKLPALQMRRRQTS
jgi:hypothetical protein